MFPMLHRKQLRLLEFGGFLFGLIAICFFIYINKSKIKGVHPFYKYGLLFFGIASIIVDGYLVLAE